MARASKSRTQCDDLRVGLGAPLAPGAFMLARDGRHHRLDLPRKLALRHVLIVGPSGAGKSRGFFMGNCARARSASFLATDPKGELWRTTSGFHARALRFAPREPDASEAFNWVPLCRAPNLALLLARALMGRAADGHDDPGLEHRVLFCAALFAHAATLRTPTPAAAYDLLCTRDLRGVCAALASSRSDAARAYGGAFCLAGRGLQGRVALSVAARLAFLADPAVRRFTSARREGIDLGALRRRATAAYWVLPEDDMVPLRSLSAVFFTVLLHQLRQAAGDGALPVTLLFDEFANLGDVPNVETEVAMARGRDIALVLSVQSMGQLERLYGRAAAHTIYENCQTTIALAGLSDDTAELIAKTIGRGAVRDARGSRAAGGGLDVDAVRRLDDDAMLVVITNRVAARLERFRYDEPARTARAPRLGAALTRSEPRARDVPAGRARPGPPR